MKRFSASTVNIRTPQPKENFAGFFGGSVNNKPVQTTKTSCGNRKTLGSVEKCVARKSNDWINDEPEWITELDDWKNQRRLHPAPSPSKKFGSPSLHFRNSSSPIGKPRMSSTPKSKTTRGPLVNPTVSPFSWTKMAPQRPPPSPQRPLPSPQRPLSSPQRLSPQRPSPPQRLSPQRPPPPQRLSPQRPSPPQRPARRRDVIQKTQKNFNENGIKDFAKLPASETSLAAKTNDVFVNSDDFVVHGCLPASETSLAAKTNDVSVNSDDFVLHGCLPASETSLAAKTNDVFVNSDDFVLHGCLPASETSLAAKTNDVFVNSDDFVLHGCLPASETSLAAKTNDVSVNSDDFVVHGCHPFLALKSSNEASGQAAPKLYPSLPLCMPLRKKPISLNISNPVSKILTRPPSPATVPLPSTSNFTRDRLCSQCGREIWHEKAMKIEKLKLFFHASCFICTVCNTTLGTGMVGAEVMVKYYKLHCRNCYEAATPAD